MARFGRYETPFKVKDGIIYDAGEQKVKLWGVNYYAPFNHNYYNIKELGKDHFAAIDNDIQHFKMMGVELIRMHLYEREITDRWGNIVENHNMEVFDYLIDQCEKNDIYLMLCPTVWWNTVKNELIQNEYYAYWHIDAQDAFGFTNYYSCDSMLWDPEAVKCQQTYFEGLLSRKNRFSGRILSDYSNVVVFELFNEPRYPEMYFMHDDVELTNNNMATAMLCRGKQKEKLRAMWNYFKEQNPNEDEDKCFSMFRADIVKKYFDALLPIVDKYFGKNVLRAQFTSYSGRVPEDLEEVFDEAGFDAYSIGTYLNVDGFEATNTDSANHLEYAEKWFKRIEDLDYGKLAKVSYEFDATSTQNGYPLAAIAAKYAEMNVQVAAYFTYTPSAVAAWNPGWLVHFMSLEHTPSRAAGFATAGEIFRSHEPGGKLIIEDEKWSGSDFSIERDQDFVYYKNDKVFRYSNSNEIELSDAEALNIISGRGSSKFAESDGNGYYQIEKLDSKQYKLTVFPNQKYLSTPGRGKTYRSMSNRYVNCCKEVPVSQLSEESVKFKIKALTVKSVTSKDRNKKLDLLPDGNFYVSPGVYGLITE